MGNPNVEQLRRLTSPSGQRQRGEADAELSADAQAQFEANTALLAANQVHRHGRAAHAAGRLRIRQVLQRSCKGHGRNLTREYISSQVRNVLILDLPAGKVSSHRRDVKKYSDDVLTAGERAAENAMQRRALAWLKRFVIRRGNASRASLELGFQENWAGRLLRGITRCNWTFDDVTQMADALGETLDGFWDCVRNGTVPSPLSTTAAKPKRQSRPGRGRKKIPLRKIST